jgi:hypothetical protein
MRERWQAADASRGDGRLGRAQGRCRGQAVADGRLGHGTGASRRPGAGRGGWETGAGVTGGDGSRGDARALASGGRVQGRRPAWSGAGALQGPGGGGRAAGRREQGSWCNIPS